MVLFLFIKEIESIFLKIRRKVSKGSYKKNRRHSMVATHNFIYTYGLPATSFVSVCSYLARLFLRNINLNHMKLLSMEGGKLF